MNKTLLFALINIRNLKYVFSTLVPAAGVCLIMLLIGCDQGVQQTQTQSLADRLNPVSVTVTNGQAAIIQQPGNSLFLIPIKQGRYDRYTIQIYHSEEMPEEPKFKLVKSEMVEGNKTWEINNHKFLTGWGTDKTTSISLLTLEDTSQLAVLNSTNFAKINVHEIHWLTNNPPTKGEFLETLKPR